MNRAGEGTILFGGSGFLGPYILARNPAMISVGRTPPSTPNRHIAVESLTDLGGGPMQFRCHIATLSRLIDWRPEVSVEEGVRRTFEFAKARRQA